MNGDTTVAAAFHWMAAETAHYRGDHKAARTHAARILDELTDAASRLMRRLIGFDLEVGALRLLSLSDFLLGDVDAALALRARATARASELSHVVPLANAFYWQAFMAYLLDEAEEVDRLTTSSIESEEPNGLQPAVGTAIAVQGLSLMRRGEAARGREMIDRGLSLCQEAGYHVMDAFIRAELALQLARQGRPKEAQVALRFLDEPEEESWSSPEVLRVKGAIAELNGDLAGAEARYLDALAIAERQGALTWRLRAATSLALLRLSQGRAAEAEATLAPVHEQFNSGRVWPDLRRAADCLEDCRRTLVVVAGKQNAGLYEDARRDSLANQRGASPGKDPPGAFDG